MATAMPGMIFFRVKAPGGKRRIEEIDRFRFLGLRTKSAS